MLIRSFIPSQVSLGDTCIGKSRIRNLDNDPHPTANPQEERTPMLSSVLRANLGARAATPRVGARCVVRGIASSTQAAPGRITRNAVAATLASGLIGAWYIHLYGSPIHAMTPAEEGMHPIKWPWDHTGHFSTFDHQSLRRGYQVYSEVCSACHSLNFIAYRNLVGTTHTVEEVKAMAEQVEYDSEPNDQGEIEKRPGKLSDYLPAPYSNEEAARAANQGALPPDLSLMIKARHGGCDYVFSLLTGYPDDPPPGVEVQEGLNYNPYFPNGQLGMARVLYDGLVEYDDKTPATASQMAKDVVQFLNWTAEPEMDERKKMGMKVIFIASTLFALSVWVKRFKWAPLKNRKIVYDPPQV